jgi:hypothetical protein
MSLGRSSATAIVCVGAILCCESTIISQGVLGIRRIPLPPRAGGVIPRSQVIATKEQFDEFR